MNNREDKGPVPYINFFIKLLNGVRKRIGKINSIMEGKYSPALLAAGVTVI